MNIKEALEQMKQICTQFTREVDSLTTFLMKSDKEVEELSQTKVDIEKSISDLKVEFDAAEEKYKGLTLQLTENYERNKNSMKESLKNLEDQSNKKLSDLNDNYQNKISEFNARINELKLTSKTLSGEILEKEKLLAELNKSIEEIKSRLG